MDELRERASAGDPQAQYELGQEIYTAAEISDSRPQIEEALGWLGQAAGSGHEEARVLAAMILYKREGMFGDRDEALRLYRRLADQGISTACFEVGRSLLSDESEEGPFRQGVEAFRREVASGRVLSEDGPRHEWIEAVYYLKHRLITGATDFDARETEALLEAIRYFECSVSDKYPDARFWLGITISTSRPGEAGRAEGFAWIRKAAELGHSAAQVMVAQAYEDGILYRKSPRSADEWYAMAARGGHPLAMLKSGAAFSRRLDIANYREIATRYLKGASDAGLFEADFHRGIISTEYGDPEDAERFFLDAALQGHVESREELFRLYRSGRLAKKNWVEARCWFEMYEDAIGEELALGKIAHAFSAVEEREVAWRKRQLNALIKIHIAEREGRSEEIEEQDRAIASAGFADRYSPVQNLFEVARKGSENAQFELADRFYLGEGLDRDLAEAFFWYGEAAKSGHHEAMFKLAFMYRQGEGTVVDNIKANGWFRSAAAEIPKARYEYALSLIGEEPSERRDRLAIENLLMAWEAGIDAAKEPIEKLLISDRGANPDDARVVNVLEELAEAGHARPQYSVARRLYKVASSGPADSEELYGRAVELIRRAAEQGLPKAQFALANLYKEGKRIPGDSAEAAKWYRKAADGGHSTAQFATGEFLFHGIAGEKDEIEASRFYRKAAENGYRKARDYFPDLNQRIIIGEDKYHTYINLVYQAGVNYDPEAMVVLAKHLLSVDREKPDADRALEWLNRAADEEYVPAYTFMSALYGEGKFVVWDRIKAVRWMEEAAKLGDMNSQFSVGVTYAKGEEIFRNEEKGIEFLRMAAAQGHKDAKRLLANMAIIEEAGDGEPGEQNKRIPIELEYIAGDVYPVAPAAVYKGELLPIRSVRGRRPVARSPGSDRKLNDEVLIVMMPAKEFALGKIEIRNFAYFSPFMISKGMMVYTGLSSRFVFDAVADRDLFNCFGIIVAKRPKGDREFHWFPIGRLAAEEEKKITVHLDEELYIIPPLAVVLYSNGREVMSNNRMQIGYLGNKKEIQFFKKRADYFEQHKDASAPPKYFGEEGEEVWINLGVPRTVVAAKLVLSELGHVTEASIVGEISEDFADRLLARLFDLKFFPELQNGEAVASTVRQEVTVY